MEQRTSRRRKPSRPPEEPPARHLDRVLAMADIAPIARGRALILDRGLPTTFCVRGAMAARIDESAASTTPRLRFTVRHAVEVGVQLEDTGDPVLAGLIAARVAALFFMLEDWPAQRSAPAWLPAFVSDLPPAPEQVRRAWEVLSAHQPGVHEHIDEPTMRRLREVWALLGPAEYLLGIGGDVRLRLEAETGLNAYGCSPRPRPWAVTFASSTASSVSERGYEAAEASRRSLVRETLAQGAESATRAAANHVRHALAEYFSLPSGTAVVLTPSGTDGELCALALTCLAQPPLEITNVVVAPEESGTGVPLAATGRHFATLTARGLPVSKGALIDGFPNDVELLGVPARNEQGGPRAEGDIEADCDAAVAAAVAAGRRVLLHVIDQSKTGLVAPTGGRFLTGTRLEQPVDVVVDACQARLSVESIQRYVRRGFMVLVTGSKFFTGPPFAGALFVPSSLASRLRSASRLPTGLAEYVGRFEWPEGVAASCDLRPDANVGVALRWEAALAEMTAFAKMGHADVRHALISFGRHVREAIRENPYLVGHDPPQLKRENHESWDALPTIFAFSVRSVRADGTQGLLSPDEARQVHRWLNSDLSPCLPESCSPKDCELARRRVHLGQPIALRTSSGEATGALRISAGARLVSGEPSRAKLTREDRLEREIRDALAALDKVSLVMRHIEAIRRIDPKPSFGSEVDP